jgi:hypothetical protein
VRRPYQERKRTGDTTDVVAYDVIAEWVETQLAQRPGEDIETLAREAGVPPHRARAALEQRE